MQHGQGSLRHLVLADGFSAGHDQTDERPFGEGDTRMLHSWMFETPEENRDELARITSARAFIMGRNMFGPVRGPWHGARNGWWGSDPPYHAPVFVLTHQERPPQPMDGGTTFHFVTTGIEFALEWAHAVAAGGDVAISGGASTINQFLTAGLIDELRLHITPMTLGSGTRLFDGVPPLEMQQVSARGASLVTHLVYRLGSRRSN